MEKRLILAFILSFLVLTVWSKFFSPPPSQAPSEYSQHIENKEAVEALSFRKSDAVFGSSAVIQEAVKVEEKIHVLENDLVYVEFSNIGGVLKKVVIKAYEAILPVTDIQKLAGYGNVPFELESTTGNSVLYVTIVNGLKVTKKYTLNKDAYTLFSEINIGNMSEMSKLIDLEIEGFTLDISRLDKKIDSRTEYLYEYAVAVNEKIIRKTQTTKLEPKHVQKMVDENIDWIGFRNRYFCAIIDPMFDLAAYEIKIDEKNGYCINVDKENNVKNISAVVSSKELCTGSTDEGKRIWHNHIYNSVTLPKIELLAKKDISLSSTIYVGPQDFKILKEVNKDYADIVSFKIGGFFDVMSFGLTDVVAKSILNYLQLLSKIFKNLGVCIILLAITIFFVTYPLTRKSMESMKKIQVLNPEIARIKEEYKNNQEKQQKATMELYRKHKVNPLGGCLPMLLQMPIFMGLFQLLGRSVVFKGASFLWIKDLSEPDRLIVFSQFFPIIGNEFNILPILYAGLMVLQQKFSSKNMAGAATPEMAQQQKMMMVFMPVLICFIFYKFASGLALYFSVFYVLQTFVQWKMSKTPKVT